MAVKSGTVYCLTSHIQPLPAKNEPIRYKWSKKSRLVLWSFANYHMLTKGLRRECMNEAKMIRLSCCRPSIHTCQVTLLYFTLRTMGALCRTKTHQANWVFTFTTKKNVWDDGFPCCSDLIASPTTSGLAAPRGRTTAAPRIIFITQGPSACHNQTTPTCAKGIEKPTPNCTRLSSNCTETT